MAVRKSKVESEKMTDENIERVIKLLNPTDHSAKPITKKEACEILGMSYNTSRLTTVLSEYAEKKEREAKRRAENRGKPATQEEIAYCIKSYILDSESISSIAKSLYRSTSFVLNILNNNGVTIRPNNHDYFIPALINESSIRETFAVGDIAYNSRYNTNCIIKSEQDHKIHGKVYKVWLLGEYQQYAYTAAYDLGSLEVLKQVNG